MSVYVQSWVFEHSQARLADRLVLLAIADAASADGGQAYPRRREIARKAAISERQVARSIDQLIDLGELEITGRRLVRGRWRNEYRVIMTSPNSPPPQDNPSPQKPESVVDNRPRGDNPSGHNPVAPGQSVTQHPRRGVTTCPSPGDNLSATKDNHPEPPTTSISPTAPPADHRDAGGGGGGGGGDQSAPTGPDASAVSNRVTEVLTGLPVGWQLGARSTARLGPAIQRALDAGWTPADLAAHLGANPNGVRSHYAVLAARLTDLPAPPIPAPQWPTWCGHCDQTTRLVDLDDGRVTRCTCHPKASHPHDQGAEI